MISVLEDITGLDGRRIVLEDIKGLGEVWAILEDITALGGIITILEDITGFGGTRSVLSMAGILILYIELYCNFDQSMIPNTVRQTKIPMNLWST